jgi:cupin 2 domain-containing protein
LSLGRAKIVTFARVNHLHLEVHQVRERIDVSATKIGNLLVDIPAILPVELAETLAENRHVRIERIVSHGHASPAGFWYARLRFEDQTLDMKPGDFVNIPAHEKHRVEWTTPDEPTVWLAVFYG